MYIYSSIVQQVLYLNISIYCSFILPHQNISVGNVVFVLLHNIILAALVTLQRFIFNFPVVQ